MEDQIDYILNKNVVDFNQATLINLENEPEIISDVTDGSFYRNFLKTNEGAHVRSGNGMTFSINTDGADPSDKSTIALWPVFISINEIPIGERYCIENTIIAGKYIYCNRKFMF